MDDAAALILRDEARGDIKRFYAERGYRPLWVRSGRIVAAAQSLLGYIESARPDGLKPASYDPGDLRAALDAANGGDAGALARAEPAPSKGFPRHLRDPRPPPAAGLP